MAAGNVNIMALGQSILGDCPQLAEITQRQLAEITQRLIGSANQLEVIANQVRFRAFILLCTMP